MTEYTVRKGEIGWALEYLKNGYSVRRKAWADESYLVMLDADYVKGVFEMYDEGVQNTFFLVKFRDLMADDWELYEGKDGA